MSTTTLVTKRDGTIEEFCVDKVKKCIDWACEGLEVNPLALESKFNEFLNDEVTSESIQEHLITSARMLANAAETDWVFVAGRLWTMDLWKVRHGYGKHFSEYLNVMIESGEYNGPMVDKLLSSYSQSDLDEFDSMIDSDYDLYHSYGSVLTAVNKYLTPNECVQQMHMVNAMCIGVVADGSSRNDFVKKLYTKLAERKLSLATPWLANLRSGGNISSCFIIEPNDSIESIFDNVKNAALISKMGGGLGISMARIRAEGSEVDGRSDASKGVFGWTRIFNDVALFVDQGGKRAGAFTVSVPVWHRDIEGFLEIQSETGESRNKAFDIFPQVTVCDLFMKKDAKDGSLEWHTFCPYEVRTQLGIELADLFGKDFEKAYSECVKAYNKGALKNVKVYPVRDLMKKIMRPQFDSGLPYFNFIDTINNDNPNNHEGVIPCGNLCQESFSVVKPDEYGHSCNLASVTVGRCKDLSEVVEIARLATRVLDYGIELTNNPTKITGAHNERYRTIGVGVQGACDWLAKESKSYKDHKESGRLMEAIQFGCVSESVQLAKELGRYPAFEGSKWDTEEQFDPYFKNQSGEFDWESVKEDCSVHGIRNSQLTSPAPNTSTSVFMDAGAGVMPAYGGFYLKDNGNGLFPFASMYVKEKSLFYAKTAAKWEHEHLVNTVSAMQVFTDAGISTEYFFDHNKEGFSAKDLYELIHYAWKKKTKALYYIRHIKKGKSFNDEVGTSEAACDGCSG